METLEELEAKYSCEMSQKERAELEDKIWSLVPRSSERVIARKGRAIYFGKKFGVGQSAVRSRHYLHRAGDAADPLWDRIQKDMTLNSALGIMQKAWELKTGLITGTPISLKDAVVQSIENYDSADGTYTAVSAGKHVRRKLPSSLQRPRSDKTKSKSKTSSRTFWNEIRSLIGEYANSRLEGSDPIIRERILKNFEVDLNSLLSDFQKELYKAPKVGLESVVVSRKTLIRACRILGMDPPKPGNPVNMKLANTQKKRHARMYHPDVQGGSTDTTEQYLAAMEAYRVMQQYNENFVISSVQIEGNGEILNYGDSNG